MREPHCCKDCGGGVCHCPGCLPPIQNSLARTNELMVTRREDGDPVMLTVHYNEPNGRRHMWFLRRDNTILGMARTAPVEPEAIP